MIIGIGCNRSGGASPRCMVSCHDMKCAVNASGRDLSPYGSDLLGTEMSAIPRKMLSVPKVTMNGCIRRPTTSAPLTKPQSNPIPSGTITASGNTAHRLAFSGKFCSTAAVASAASPKIEPTEISIPPATMTNVTPIAMIAIHDMGVATLGMTLSRRKKLLTVCPRTVIGSAAKVRSSPSSAMTTSNPASCIRGKRNDRVDAPLALDGVEPLSVVVGWPIEVSASYKHVTASGNPFLCSR